MEIEVVGWRYRVVYEQESLNENVEKEKEKESARRKKENIAWIIYPVIQWKAIIGGKRGYRIIVRFVRNKEGLRRVNNKKLVQVEECLGVKYISRVIGGREGIKEDVKMGVNKVIISTGEICRVSIAEKGLYDRISNGSIKRQQCNEGWDYLTNLHLEKISKGPYISKRSRKETIRNLVTKIRFILKERNEHVPHARKRREERRNEQNSIKKGRVNSVWWVGVSVCSVLDVIVSKGERSKILGVRLIGDNHKYKSVAEGMMKVNKSWYNMDIYCMISNLIEHRYKGKDIGYLVVSRNYFKPSVSISFYFEEKNCADALITKAISIFTQKRRNVVTIRHCLSKICRDRGNEEIGLVRYKHNENRSRSRRKWLKDKNCAKNSVSGLKEVVNNSKCRTEVRRFTRKGGIINKVNKHDIDNCRCYILNPSIVRNEDIEIENTGIEECIGTLIKAGHICQLWNITNLKNDEIRMALNKGITNVKNETIRMNSSIGSMYDSMMVGRNCMNRKNKRKLDPYRQENNPWNCIYKKMDNLLIWKLGNNIRDWLEEKLIDRKERIDLRRWGWKPILRISQEDQIGPNIINLKENNRKRERIIKNQYGKDNKRGEPFRVKLDVTRCLKKEKKLIIVEHKYSVAEYKNGRIEYSKEESKNRNKVIDRGTWKNRAYRTAGTEICTSAVIRIKGNLKSELKLKGIVSESRADVMIKYLCSRWSRREWVMWIWFSLVERNKELNRKKVQRNRGKCGRVITTLQMMMGNDYNNGNKSEKRRLTYSQRKSFLPLSKLIMEYQLGKILAKECIRNISREYKGDAAFAALPRLQWRKQCLGKNRFKSVWKTVRYLSIKIRLIMTGHVKFDKLWYANVWLREKSRDRRNAVDKDLKVCLISFCCKKCSRIRISFNPGVLCSKFKMKKMKLDNIKEKMMSIKSFLSYNAKIYWNYLHLRIKVNYKWWFFNVNHVISYWDSRVHSLRMRIYNTDKTNITDTDIWRMDRGDAETTKPYVKGGMDTQGKIEILNENG